MRFVIGLGLFLTATAALAAPSERYGVALDAKTFPQGSAKETMSSVLKAIDAKRVDYLAAQLADPVFVDDQVKRLYGGKFDEETESLQARLDAPTVKRLRAFQADGEWTGDKDQATVRLKDLPGTVVRFKRIDDRWYLQNASKP